MFGMGYEKMSKRTFPAVLLVSAPRSLINEVILCSDRFLFPKFRGDISPWISSSRSQAPVRSTPFCSPWNASPNGQFSSPLYQIELPPDWRIFNIFHVSLLRPFTPLFDSQTPTPSPPIELSEDVSIPVYQVANILNSRNNSSTGKLEYLVEWAGREGTNEQVSWQLPSDLTDNGADTAIAEFHERYPAKPSNDTPPPRSRRPPGRPRKKPSQVSSSSDPQSSIPISTSTSASSQASPPVIPTPSLPNAPHTPPSEQQSNQLVSSSTDNSQNNSPAGSQTINPVSQTIPLISPPVTTSSRPSTIPFRPKQPANWKGWALVPDLPPVVNPINNGPTSRSGRPLKSKTHFE